MNNNDIKNTDKLSSINQKVVMSGEVLPTVQLKDGSRVQTGTVATLLHNINSYNLDPCDQLKSELELAIPTLFKVGMFDLFTPEEWVNSSNPGRRFVGELAKEYLATQGGAL